ncbi:hypothetical protein [Roseomonas chloroacetimidivorans]
MGGYAIWPDGGGLNDQAAWVLDAFGILVSLNAKLDEEERPT